jgi:hypothetical protein
MKNKIKTYVITGILLVFSFYVLPLNAANETITGDLTLSDTNPQLLFNDTSETGTDWSIIGNEFRFIVYNYDTGQWSLWFEDDADMQLSMHATLFRIRDQSSNTIASFHRDAPLSLDIQSDGDVSLAGGDVFIDTSTNFLGIGTTAPIDDLEIQSTSPSMYFDDTSADSTDWWVGNFLNDFVFKVQDNGTGGPINTKIMTLDAQTGFVGIGTDTPTTPLHVASAAGNAKILVEETGGAAARTLLQLKNNGNTKLGILNTEAGIEWILANPGTGLQFSRNGTGDVEMEILNNGNLVVAGGLSVASDVNSKTAFTDIDSYKILNRIAELPVTKWEYKDAPGETHIGPMAQDFHAAFGLGATETRISTIDADGVALAAIKALIEENAAFKEQNLSLEQRVIELEQQNQRIEELEQQNQRIEELVMRMVMDQAEQVAMK